MKEKTFFTYHKSVQIIYYVLFFIILLETPIVHFLLTLWLGNAIAWIITLLTIGSIIYMIIDFLALKRKPIIIKDDTLHFHLGVRQKADIPLSKIENISSINSLSYEDRKDIWQLSPLHEINTLITFKEPIAFKGIFGRERISEKIAIFLDEPSIFQAHILSTKGDL